MTAPAPTVESFWVTPKLLAGKYPGASVERDALLKLDSLLAAGVWTFIDLTEEDELLPYAHLLPAGVSHVRIPVVDVTCPTREQVRSALDATRRGQDRGVVYVHCRGGCGRTGVVVGCYLVEQGCSGDAALTQVHELTRGLWSKPCPETSEQIEMVRGWADPAATNEPIRR